MKEIWGLHKNPADMVQGVQSFEAIDIQGGPWIILRTTTLHNQQRHEVHKNHKNEYSEDNGKKMNRKICRNKNTLLDLSSFPCVLQRRRNASDKSDHTCENAQKDGECINIWTGGDPYGEVQGSR